MLAPFRRLCLSALVLSSALRAAGEGKHTIAVSDFSPQGIEQSDALILSDRIRSELVNTGQFRVMERGQMEEILKEQGLQMSGACDDKACIIEAGQLLGVQKMVAGTVGRIGKTYTISARVIDVRTGEILFSESVDCKCEIGELLSESTKELSERIAGKAGAGTAPAVSDASPRRRPFYKRAFFWVPIGVVAAGAAGYAVWAARDTDEEPETGAVKIQWEPQ